MDPVPHLKLTVFSGHTHQHISAVTKLEVLIDAPKSMQVVKHNPQRAQCSGHTTGFKPVTGTTMHTAELAVPDDTGDRTSSS